MSADVPQRRLAEVLDRPAAELAALHQAVEESLRYVPALLRGAVKAAVGLR